MAAKPKAKTKATAPVGAIVLLPGKRIPVKIKTPDDKWSEFKLVDGTTIRLRHLIIDVSRIEGQFAADGQPVYEIKGGTMLEVLAPAKLRKK